MTDGLELAGAPALSGLVTGSLKFLWRSEPAVGSLRVPQVRESLIPPPPPASLRPRKLGWPSPHLPLGSQESSLNRMYGAWALGGIHDQTVPGIGGDPCRCQSVRTQSKEVGERRSCQEPCKDTCGIPKGFIALVLRPVTWYANNSNRSPGGRELSTSYFCSGDFQA